MIKKILTGLILCLIWNIVEAKAITYGIIVPLKDESSYFQRNISQSKNVSIEGIKYTLGKINNINVIFVNSGMGKVNAAVIATRLIRDFHPNIILLSGSAGAINPGLKAGEVVVGKNVIDADFGKLTSKGVEFIGKRYLVSPQTNTALPLEFRVETLFVNIINHLNNINSSRTILGNIATSDALPNLPSQVKLLQEGKFDVIEMEGSAVMQACWLFSIPCVVIRGVSNTAGAPPTPESIKLAGDNAAKIATEVILNYRY